MMVLAANPAAPVTHQPRAVAAPFDQPVGKIAVAWRRDEPIWIDASMSGPEKAFASIDDAVRGASFMSEQGISGNGTRGSTGHLFAILREQDGYRAHQLLQASWKRSGLVDVVAGRADFIAGPTGQPTPDGHLPVDGSTVRVKDYASIRRTPISGVLKLDAGSGVLALVGSGWAVQDGAMRVVKGADPFPPPPPPESPKADVLEAVKLIQKSIATIETVPVSDTGSDDTKQVRINAYKQNMEAQELLEGQFLRDDLEPNVISEMRLADASLEDANWQLAKKPSPDGRFNGVDIPGALRDSRTAVEILAKLAERLPE